MNPDMLAAIFEAQDALNARYSISGVPLNKTNITDEQLTNRISKLLAAMYNECEELRSHTNWKWWKEYEKPIDRNQVKIEIVDILHFLTSMALTVMTAEEMHDIYMKKNQLNHHRQDVGYNDQYQKVDENGLEDNDKLFIEENREQ